MDFLQKHREASAGLGVALIASLLLAATITADGGTHPTFVSYVAAAAVAFLAYRTLRGRTVVGLVMVFGYLAFGLASALLYHPPTTESFYASAPQVYGYAETLASTQYLVLFTVAAASMWVGFAVVSIGRPRTSAGMSLAPGATETMGNVPSFALILAALPLLLDVYGVGPHTVLYAAMYLQHTGPADASKVGRALGPVGILIAGYLLMSRRTSFVRVLSALVVLGYAALYLGTATRAFGLIPLLLYLAGLLAGRWDSKGRVVALVVAVVAAILMIEIPLALRGLPQHGLVAAINYLASDPARLFSDPISNLLFGAPLILFVAHAVPPLPTHDLVTSLSPLPSSLTDWGAIQPTLRVNEFMPFAALGELLNHGWATMVIVLAVMGAWLGVLEQMVMATIAPRLGLLVLTGVGGLAVLESTEYNLRSDVRLYYYAAVVVVGLWVISRVAGAGLGAENRRVLGSPVR